MEDRAVCHDILHFSARVLVSSAGQFRQFGHRRLTELSVMTFCTFLREFSPPSSHYRRPPPIAVGSCGSLTVNGSAPVPGFPLRRPPRAYLGYCPSDASSRPASVPAGSQKFAGPAVTLPIRFRPCLACLLPGGFRSPGSVVPVLEVHLVRRLPLERGMR